MSLFTDIVGMEGAFPWLSQGEVDGLPLGTVVEVQGFYGQRLIGALFVKKEGGPKRIYEMALWHVSATPKPMWQSVRLATAGQARRIYGWGKPAFGVIPKEVIELPDGSAILK